MTILKGDQPCLQRPQQRDRAGEDQRRPQHDMKPDWRRESDFDPGGATDDDKPEKQNDEDGRSITSVLGRKIEAADWTELTHGQQPAEELPLAAARATASQRRSQRRYREEGAGLWVHGAPRAPAESPTIWECARSFAAAHFAAASMRGGQPPTPSGTALPMPHQ